MRAEKIPTQFDIPEMAETYNKSDNYEIFDFENDDDRCYIFFSGNGLFYPNDQETFHRVVIEQNRYEWKRNIPHFARRVIFLRDVKKTWYFEGINADLNTIEKVTAFLQFKTEGMKVICIGNSAGGYAATLFGCLLKASHIINFSGQFSLIHIVQTEQGRALNPVLAGSFEDAKYRKYFSIVDIVKKSGTPVFYLFPARCPEDMEQSSLVGDIPSVYEFRFDTENHGETCFEINFMGIFAQTRDELLDFHLCYKDGLICPFLFSVRISGLGKSCIFYLHRKVKRGIAKILNG